ncbi:hypothetical protein [Zoogloea sp.]|uniref:hypothetical protein n=1 Tax=Zoogloea sp. TaxID=49181 RepID=UPI001DDC5B98|nr:hypothetical protein [Zoogloea sp.]MBK6652386.1 hypothetical protein [Zoogloea sp.]
MASSRGVDLALHANACGGKYPANSIRTTENLSVEGATSDLKGAAISTPFHPEIESTHLLPAPGVRCCVALFQPESDGYPEGKRAINCKDSDDLIFYQQNQRLVLISIPCFWHAACYTLYVDSPGAFIPEP